MRKHHCSQGSQPEEPRVLLPDYITEYQDRFPGHWAVAVRSSKKLINEYKPPEGKIANLTTFSSDYVAHEVTQRPPKVPRTYVPPDGHMRHTSTYDHDYPTHSVQKNIVTKREEYHPPTVKMVAQSLQKEDYRAWNAEKRQPCRMSDNLKMNEGKFEVTTTFRADFCPKGPAEARESFKPTPEVRETLPFDGATNYKTQYVRHPVQNRRPREKPTYRPTSAPLDGVSTHRQDYKGLPAEAVKPIRAKVAWESSTAAFEGISEFRDKYKAWPMAPRHRHKAKEYCPPEGDMDFLTTAHADYLWNNECQQRPPSARPPIQAWVTDREEPFQARSTMKEDYRAWETVRRPPMVRTDELQKPTGEFENTTTFRSAYTPKTAPRTASFKPSQKPTEEEATVYRSAHTPKEIPPCLAQNSSPPGFEYTSTSASGHRLYRTISVEATGLTQQASATRGKPSYSHSKTTCRVPSRAKRAP